MALRVNFNFEAAASHTAIVQNEREMNKSLLRLSTGLRILNAADDSAGLFIADQLMVVGSGLEEGNRNIQTALSALRIAESSAGQIYDRLNEIYKRTVRAANDINDPNARASLQREIDNFVDAIKKIGTDTEYNGIKLLDGTFSGKAIHYGARKDQILNVGIDSLLPNDIGAYMASGQGSIYKITKGTNVGDFATQLTATSNQDFMVETGEYVDIAGIRVLAYDGYRRFVDAATLANNINSNQALQALGIEAVAKNDNKADQTYTGFANFWSPAGQTDTVSSVTLNFYIGNAIASGSPNFSVGIDSNITTVQQLADAINTQASAAGAPISAKVVDNKLVLETAHGETIAVQAVVNATIASNGVNINLGQILQGAGTVSVTAAANTNIYYIDVGTVDIAGISTYKLQYNGVSSLSAGFNFKVANNNNAIFKNLYSVSVLTNQQAEQSMLIAKKALQRVDTVRAQIGAVMNNLQSIYDSQKVAWDNTKEAENVIRNTDYAQEMTNFTKLQIKMQSSMAMLAQANQLPQLVLQLLR